MVTVPQLEMVDAHGAGAVDDCPPQRHRHILRLVRGALPVVLVQERSLMTHSCPPRRDVVITSFPRVDNQMTSFSYLVVSSLCLIHSTAGTNHRQRNWKANHERKEFAIYGGVRDKLTRRESLPNRRRCSTSLAGCGQEAFTPPRPWDWLCSGVRRLRILCRHVCTP